MNRVFEILVLCTLVSSIYGAAFDNFAVFRTKVVTESQLTVLQGLESNPKDYMFAEAPTQVNSNVDLLVSPGKLLEFTSMMQANNIEAEIAHPNFQAMLDEESPINRPRAMDWTNFHNLEEIYAWLDQLAVEFPNSVSLFDIGASYEGRRTRGIRLSQRAGNQAIFIESNIHSREWASSATSTFFLNELLRSSNPEIRNLADHYDWYIIPVANPDGFEYSKTTGNRLWRKTRSQNANNCWGVDGNRNFGYKWMEGGASANPCSDTFAGVTPFSEPETQNIADFYMTISHNVVIYLSFHTYGQYLLFPLGTDSPPVANFADLTAIGRAAGDALRVRFGTEYAVGNSKDVLYATSGTSVDWAYGAAHTLVGYTYEFRDRGAFGFVLPPAQIIDNGLEVVDSLIALVAKTRELGYFRPLQ